jgi:uncharacterized membrane protein
MTSHAWRGDRLPLALIAAMFAMAVAAWPGAPARMPLVWQAWNDPPGEAGRALGLFLQPVLALGVWSLLRWLPAIDPRRDHYDAFRGTYALVRTLLVATLFAAQVFTIHLARGGAGDAEVFIALAVGTLAVVLGNYAPKLKSNWFFGVRTPWTLSSEESWRRTHRLAGWLMVASGTVILAVAVLRPADGRTAIFGTLVPTLLISTVYSYFAWRADPRRGERPRDREQEG